MNLNSFQLPEVGDKITFFASMVHTVVSIGEKLGDGYIVNAAMNNGVVQALWWRNNSGCKIITRKS
jgi:hypothetical protein